jgi:hypothetical protein
MSLPTVPLPSVPTDFQELRDCKVEQLEQLEMNQTALDEFISNMAIVTNYRKARDETDIKARDMAEANVSAYLRLNEAQLDIIRLSQTLDDIRTRVEASFSERDSLMSKFTPKNLLRDLDSIAERSDKETDKILGDFSSLESAKMAVLNSRILHHKAKALADLISSHGSRAVSPRSTARI